MIKATFLFIFILFAINISGQNSITSINPSGDIPTSLLTYDYSCTGPNNKIAITLPAGDNYMVTSIDISYTMTATSPGFMEDQRSFVRCITSNISDGESSGIGGPGTFPYNKTSNIANGTYAGNTTIEFEILARRVYNDIPGCTTATNKINNNSWTIVLHYSNVIPITKVGVNQESPSQTMDINGKLKVGNDNAIPNAGTIRWNQANADFEGFNGTDWVSFTKSNSISDWGNVAVTERSSHTINSIDEAFSNLGEQVAMHNNFAVAGMRGKNYDLDNLNTGAIQIYSISGNNWVPYIDLYADDYETGSNFGRSVAIDGLNIAVGSPFKDIGSNDDQGKVYIFENFTDPTFIGLQSVVAFDGNARDRFGASIDIFGGYLVVGSPLYDAGPNINQGKVYIYKRGPSSWNLLTTLLAPDGTENDNFGFGIDLYENQLVISAPSKQINGVDNEGMVYVYRRSEDSFILENSIAQPSGYGADFGLAVSIKDNELIVGSPSFSNAEFTNLGRVYYYKKIGINWSLITTIVPSDNIQGDNFGESVSLDGNNLLVSAIQNNGTKPNTGKVYLYAKENASWKEMTQLKSSDGDAYDKFGKSVSMSFGKIIIGAPGKSYDFSTQAGACYFFNKN